MKAALVLVDIQNDYFAGGRMELIGMESAATTAKNLLDYARNEEIAVVHIQHVAVRANATFFLPNTSGVAINGIVAPLANETVIEKNFPNSFKDTDLLSQLTQADITDLIICGAMTHMCIDATTRAAFDFGFRCTIIEDACATKNLTHGRIEVPAQHVQASFLSSLQSVYARVISAQELLNSGHLTS